MELSVWADIDLKAIKSNMQLIRELISPGVEIMAVVKANAYGHGANKVSRTCLEAGADNLGVAIIEEAVDLRNIGITKPILVLGHTPIHKAQIAIEMNVTQTIYTLDQARSLSELASRIGKKAKIHLKVDTGMGRLGFTEGNWKDIYAIAKLRNLEIEGIFTHFAVADCDPEYTRLQQERFDKILFQLKKDGIEIPKVHAANSAGIIQHPESYYNMVRPGLIIYGLYPDEGVDKSRIKLTPAMSLKTRIVHLKQVPPGTKISYGGTFVAENTSLIATIPIGYAHGYSRLLSNAGYAVVNGGKAPVVGRICMDQTMIDVTNLKDVKVGDEVLLFGHNNSEILPVEEVASTMGTVNYEIICKVSNRVPRIYLE
ncbi:alanine racemase [Desulfitispora alkaliphila]|uniref:alanine racemase n=1 Tax=Desulfitispora alkaliphila TaxID=622674 RepID=UPI003D1AB877